MSDVSAPQSGALYKDAAGTLYVTLATDGSDGLIHITRQGGGWVQKITAEEFSANYKPAAFSPYAAVLVDADFLPDGTELPAYSNGARWNGWAMPYFDAETGHRLVTLIPELSFDASADAFVFKADGDDGDDAFEACTIMVEGKSVKAYPIGAGCWTWSFADPQPQAIADVRNEG